MSVILKDHERILDEFLEDVRSIEEHVRSFVLFGTAGRGDIIPGESDLMDAYVFLKHEVFEDKELFIRTVESMCGAFIGYAEKSPFPTHAYFYWDEMDPVPGHFRREMTTFSRVILGEDIRESIKSTPASYRAGRTAFFEIRRMGMPLMAYLHKKELTKGDCQAIYNGLLVIVKHIPMSACMALNRWVGLPEGAEELRRALPDLDTGVLDKITMLRHEPDRTGNPERLRGLLKEAMVFVEELNNQLVTRLKNERFH